MRKFFTKHRIFFGFGRREEGSSAVEFAICLIPLLLIIGGILDFGQLWYMQSMLATASREGARYATRYYAPSGTRVAPINFNPSVANYVLNDPGQNSGNLGFGLINILPSDANPSVIPGGAGYSTGTAGAQVSVRVTADKYWNFVGSLIPGLTNPQTLQSTTVMTCE
ncbi:MAG: TadE/TadG family type IV pilus assembly protein [Thermodesulfobacteriota bacterium]